MVHQDDKSVSIGKGKLLLVNEIVVNKTSYAMWDGEEIYFRNEFEATSMKEISLKCDTCEFENKFKSARDVNDMLCPWLNYLTKERILLLRPQQHIVISPGLISKSRIKVFKLIERAEHVATNVS
jgi:hypothetical protein